MKILFLYSEVAGYFLACAEALHQIYGCEVHIVRWPINSEAPFKFREYEGVHFHERSEMQPADIFALYKQLEPSIVYVSGWMDKGYLEVAKRIRKTGTPVVCGSDNQWRGDLRQRIATFISPFYLKSSYSHLWVPGRYQYEFARRLGYSPTNILTGMYSADVAPFHEGYERFLPEKKKKYPHNFLFVGRFVDVKGVKELFEAFANTCKSFDHDWSLTLVGTGPLEEQLPSHPRITFQPFVQPELLPDLLKNSGCFVLPSKEEPWGVVLHEFSAGGLPLLASTTCGAATAFVKDGYNGFIHLPDSVPAIQQALEKIIQSSDDVLLDMGKRSIELSKQITPAIWGATLLSILN